MPRKDYSQAVRLSIANGISKKWKIARQTKTPRSFVNEGNDCHRNAALQPLLHLPRFLNWILQHNKHGQKWSCHQGDPNRTLNGLDALTQGILLDTSFKTKTKAHKDTYLKRPNGGTIRAEDLKNYNTNLEVTSDAPHVCSRRLFETTGVTS